MDGPSSSVDPSPEKVGLTALSTGPPAKKRRFNGKPKGSSGKPERNQESLIETPKLSHSQMGVLQSQMQVACDLTGIPGCVERVSAALRLALQDERSRQRFSFCHQIAVLYNQWLLVDRQSVNRYGFGPTIASREMVMLHDITAAYVEALSAIVLPNGVKLSTSTEYIVPELKRVIRAAANRSLNELFGRDFPEDDFTLESFPLGDVLIEWEILRAKAARFCGNLSSWRVPDCKEDFSLLASGVYLVGDCRTSVGTSPLPQRLEKVCLALALVRYDRLGPSSYLPQVIHDDDKSSLALRCGVYSGLTLTRNQALEELMIGAAPLSRV